MIRNELGFVANDNVRRWTKTAQNCYLIGCRCEICPCYELMKNQPKGCQMKAAVLELVKKHGIPEGEAESEFKRDSDTCSDENLSRDVKRKKQ